MLSIANQAAALIDIFNISHRFFDEFQNQIIWNI